MLKHITLMLIGLMLACTAVTQADYEYFDIKHRERHYTIHVGKEPEPPVTKKAIVDAAARKLCRRDEARSWRVKYWEYEAPGFSAEIYCRP